jgi:sugar/nucleoside kinase (ribokinase family)
MAGGAPRFEVAGLGNALVDALVRMDEVELLSELGLPRGQMTPVSHERWHQVFDRVQSHGVQIHSGGSCANTLAGLGFLGASVTWCGQVGDDQMGHLYAQRMSEAMGQHSLVWSRQHATGKCLSLVSTRDAERTMLTDLGAAIHLQGLGTFDDVLRQSGLLHVEGYLLLGDPMLSRAREAIAIANQEQIPVSIDASDPFVVHSSRDAFQELLEEFASIVFLNAEEATLLTGKPPEEAIHIVGRTVETVVIKLGARGALARRGDELVSVPAHRVEAVDTTGAGDAYAAGFLYGRVKGWGLLQCAQLGARVAALTVGQVGAVVRDRAAMAAAVAAVAG